MLCYNYNMKKHFLTFLFSALFFALSASGCAADPPSPEDILPPPEEALPTETPGMAFSVTLINTGESDAILLQTEEGAFLVDTGLKKQFPALEAALSRLGVSELSAVILTHGHKDHIGGLKKLLETVPVSAIYTSAIDDETYSDKEMKTILTAKAEHITLKKGDTFTLAGISLTVLAPDRKYMEDLGEDDNDNSLVLRMEAGSTVLLFMGDATANIERQLLLEGVPLSADILKVGRHGKDDASLPEFLRAVSPKYALITGSHAEENDSPSPAVLANLASLGATCYSNDTPLLALTLSVDGKGNISPIQYMH